MLPANSGPGQSSSTGLARPTGLAVDASGNLYVVDTGNNRILRYRNPTRSRSNFRTWLIGQTSLSCATCSQPNSGWHLREDNLCLRSGGTVCNWYRF